MTEKLSTWAGSLGFAPLGLRLLSMAAKFALLFVLARTFPPEVVGNYGLFTTLVMFGIYVAGLEFYVFTNRKLFASPEPDRRVLVVTQLFMAVPIVVIGAAVVVGWYGKQGSLQGELLRYLIPIALLEYLGQELYRALVVFDRQLSAAIALFLRTGLWCIVAGIAFVGGARDVRWLFGTWLLCDLAAVGFGVWALRDAIAWRRLPATRPSASLAREGLAISVKFLALSLSLRSLEYIDRFFIDAHAGKVSLGVYTYFWSVASVIQSLLVVSVINVWFPKMVNAEGSDAVAARDVLFRRLTRTMILGGLATAAVVYGVGLVAAHLFGKPEYTGQSGLFLLLVCASLLAAVAQAPQLRLYSEGRDSSIVVGGVIAALLSVALNAMLIPRLGLQGAALAYLAGSAWMVIFYFRRVAVLTARSMPP